MPVNSIAVVVIGRNEGERLHKCLHSVVGHAGLVVYVDSGSTDGSLEVASRLNAIVVQLDTAVPFTAARARNAGFRRVLALAPETAYVQFVDGDCEVRASWLPLAMSFLEAHPDVAAVSGRRRERFPERSIYNLLCDMDWNGPAGPASSAGGDVMMRTKSLMAVDGYRDDLIAGEESELCVRLRRQGWRIWRLADEMTLHDAAILRFGQWWRRSMRTGYAFAEGSHIHGAAPERHWVAESRSAWLWGLVLPAGLLMATLWSPVAVWGFLLYPAQAVRLWLRKHGSGRARIAHAVFLVLGKFPETLGQLKFVAHRLRGRRASLIEYK